VSLVASLVLLALAVIAPSRFALEHPRSYALCRRRVPSPSARERADHRQGQSSPGETPLVREPMADEASRYFRYRPWPRTVYEAARWPDDTRIRDKAHNRPPWHYINLPFKPEGQPDSVQTREPEPVNILTALAENESVVKN